MRCEAGGHTAVVMLHVANKICSRHQATYLWGSHLLFPLCVLLMYMCSMDTAPLCKKSHLVSLYICIYIYTYIYIYWEKDSYIPIEIYVYIYRYMIVYICISLCIYMCMYTYIYLYICVCVYVSWYVSMKIYIYIYMHICLYPLTDKMKCRFFHAAVLSILLYGCTTWTLTKRLEKKLDGNYTRMLRAIWNKSWQQHPTRHQLYGHLPPITKTIQVRRTRHAGPCWRSKDELISDVLL